MVYLSCSKERIKNIEVLYMKGYASIQMSLYLLVFFCAVFMIIMGCKLGWKYMIQKKHCTKKAEGTVVGYGKKIISGEKSQIRLPQVEYTVDGVQYRVTGPEYRSYVTRTVSVTKKKGREHTYTTDIYRQTFKETICRGSFVTVAGNPMETLFPQGSHVPVYYDPQRPKLAYVLRYCNCRYIFWMPLLCGIGLLVADFLFIIF